ncbi:hypothetical protein TWF694_008716 [Orbilia ellipsospora]|uniref:Glutathione S-transferase n=1 Tax=Orbilia ellipsospora TaxID=2528407 RepID=A0AAV9XFJ2_9PEZI
MPRLIQTFTSTTYKLGSCARNFHGNRSLIYRPILCSHFSLFESKTKQLLSKNPAFGLTIYSSPPNLKDSFQNRHFSDISIKMAGQQSAMATTEAKPKIKLIWLTDSRAQRIVWLMEELGLEYEIEAYKRTSEKKAPEDLKKYHPLGKAPILIIDGHTLVESALIIEYLVDKYGPQYKPAESDSKNFYQYRHLMHYTEGSLMPFMLLALVTLMIRNAPVPFFIRPITGRIADQLSKGFVMPNLVANYDFLESLVKDQPYFAGNELSGADIMLAYPIENAQERLGGWYNKEKYPSLYAWLERVKERPAYKRANDKVTEVEANL